MARASNLWVFLIFISIDLGRFSQGRLTAVSLCEVRVLGRLRFTDRKHSFLPTEPLIHNKTDRLEPRAFQVFGVRARELQGDQRDKCVGFIAVRRCETL